MDKKIINKLIKIHENLVSILNDIAENSKTDSSTLKKLSELNDSYIESSISTNPSTPSRILQNWLKIHCGNGGTDEEIRIHIVYNSALRLNVLKEVIEKDNSPFVQEAALLALAMRTIKDPKATPDDLFAVYIKISERKSFKNSKRIKAAKEILLKNPKFPFERIKSFRDGGRSESAGINRHRAGGESPPHGRES